jgi:hypothetical protein
MNKLTIIFTLSIIILTTLITLNFTTYSQSATHTLNPSHIAADNTLSNCKVLINNQFVKVADPNSTLFVWKSTNLTEFIVKEEKNLFNFKRYTIIKDNITQVSFSEGLQDSYTYTITEATNNEYYAQSTDGTGLYFTSSDTNDSIQLGDTVTAYILYPDTNQEELIKVVKN